MPWAIQAHRPNTISICSAVFTQLNRTVSCNFTMGRHFPWKLSLPMGRGNPSHWKGQFCDGFNEACIRWGPQIPMRSYKQNLLGSFLWLTVYTII